MENNRDNHEKIHDRLDKLGLKDTLVIDSLSALPEDKGRISPYDMAFILTPEWTHADIFETMINADYNIFMEKPLATTEDEVLRIGKLAARTERIVQVGFVMRYAPFFQTVKKAITAGKLGEIVMIEMSERLLPISGATNRRRWHRLVKNTGGFLNEKSSHDLDMMCWLKETQGKPVRIFSHGGQSFFNRQGMPQHCGECNDAQCVYRFNGDVTQNSYNAVGKIAPDTCVYNSDADILDNQSVTIAFSDGSQAIFTLLNVSAVDGREIRIHGTKGMLYGNVKTNTITLHQYRGDKKEELPIASSSSGHNGGDAAIINDFFRCVKSGRQPTATVSDGVRASLLAFAADKSVKTKQVVPIDF